MARFLPMSGTLGTLTHLCTPGKAFVCCSPHRTRLLTIHIISRATFRVFKIERKMYGTEDYPFLERVFQKLLLNFTWCVRFCFC